MEQQQIGVIRRGAWWRTLGRGIITGAADDDPSAVATYASAGAAFGPAFLWTAPAVLPMMFTVVFLSGRLAQVSGRGLAAVLRDHTPRWVLLPAMGLIVAGNVIAAAADLGGMAAALHVLVPWPSGAVIAVLGAGLCALQIFASYERIRRVFQWLALALFAYVAAALLADPDWPAVLRGTLWPTPRLEPRYLSLLVAVVGTSLSAYLYVWQTNQEVEDERAKGRLTVEERKGASEAELRNARRHVFTGMLFSNIAMYFIILAAGSTLHRDGQHEVTSAADVANALRPVAGAGASGLFAVGMIAVGCLAVPVMTTGCAYTVCQAFRWRHGLHAPPREARRFYSVIVACTAVAVGLNFLGLNPMRAMVWAGIVQGFSAPPLFLLILVLGRNPAVMGPQVNGRVLTLAGWATWVVMTSAAVALVAISAAA